MNKKILSVVLILCVMLAVMPMTAYAAVRAFCPKCDQAQTVRMTCQYANDKWHRCDLTCTVCDNTWNYWQAHTWSGTATCTSARFAADLPNRLGTTGALGRRTAMKRPTPESVSAMPRTPRLITAPAARRPAPQKPSARYASLSMAKSCPTT